MSQQASATEKIQNAASSAYESAADTISAAVADQDYDPDLDKANFKKDAHGNIAKKGDFKDKLNEAAHGRPVTEENYIEKGVRKLQRSVYQQGESEEERRPPGPPERPEHDVQVEQFLRKQYHSQSGDGMPDPDKKD